MILFSAAINALIVDDAELSSCPLPRQRSFLNQATLMLRQWLAQLLLGAVNIEQSKVLNTAHLSLLLGFQLYKDLGKQRQWLGEIATDKITQSVLRINAQQVGAAKESDFYLDPHSKHYTGEKNVLKGWCSSLGRTDKVLHSDFIHSVQGHPLYFETTDNFLDLRERIFPFIQRFRTELEFDSESAQTYVIDRGVFSAEVFACFVQSDDLHLITWDKDYRKDGWDATRPQDGEFLFERTRNHSKDLRAYHFSYQDHRWDKNPHVRWIIVRATNPRGRTIEVAVLCDDLNRPAEEIILLIFRRWVQENDFKYLDKHYGIDQITSYQATSYEALAEELADKTMLNKAHQTLTKQRQEEKRTLKNLLLKSNLAERREVKRKDTIAALKAELSQQSETTSEEAATLRKQLGNQRGQQKRAQSNLEKWKKGIEEQHQKLADIEERLTKTSKEQSRLEHLKEKQAVKMKGARKRLMDALKILARNLFYILLGPFKATYDNYRDDHVIFRSLTKCEGTIEADEHEVRCQLILAPDYAPSIRRHLEHYLSEWLKGKPEFPDGSGRALKVELITAAGVQIARQTSSVPTKH